MKRSGYTLVEIILVIAIISVLAAILLPVFSSVRENSRKTVCLSNLRQLSLALFLYADDSDDLYPAGGDVFLLHTHSYKYFFDGRYWSRVQTLHSISEVMSSYTQSPTLWNCPSDSGLLSSEYDHDNFDPDPTNKTVYSLCGSSYLYDEMLFLEPHTVSNLDVCGLLNHNLQFGASDIIVFSDASGSWHGSMGASILRRNALMADGHVVSLSEEAYQDTKLSYDLSSPCH